MSGLLAAGAIAATSEIAHAAEFCNGGPGTTATCTVSETMADPASITVSGTSVDAGTATLTWSVACSDNSGSQETQGGTSGTVTAGTQVTYPITPLPTTSDGTCNTSATVSVVASDPTNDSGNTTTVELSYTPGTAASPSPTTTTSSSGSSSGSVHPVKGYDGKCLDDRGNSSSNRAQIVIWSCSGSDPAENWTFSGGELKHNNKCLNDQGNGGSRSKVILYSCNGGANEKWSVLANGEIKLSSHNGTLCVDDPGSSKTNGTQMIVYSCKDTANQKWSLP